MNIFTAAKYAGKGLGMAATRIGGGAVIGGAIGGIASNSNTGTGWISDVAKGALIGGAIGAGGAAFGARGLAKQYAKELGRPGPASLLRSLGSGIISGGKGLAKTTGWAGKQAWGALKWVNRHPGAAGALAVGATAGVMLARSGPGNVDRSPSEMAAVAEAQGRSSSGFELGQAADRYAFEQSTQGLVQGMHRGRHRG